MFLAYCTCSQLLHILSHIVGMLAESRTNLRLPGTPVPHSPPKCNLCCRHTSLSIQRQCHWWDQHCHLLVHLAHHTPQLCVARKRERDMKWKTIFCWSWDLAVAKPEFWCLGSLGTYSHTSITSSDTRQMLVASALKDCTVVNCTWTDPEPNSIEKSFEYSTGRLWNSLPSNIRLNACRRILHSFWICVHGLVVSVCCFSVVFYFVDIHMQDSPENQLLKLRWPPVKTNIYLSTSQKNFEILGVSLVSSVVKNTFHFTMPYSGGGWYIWGSMHFI